MWCTSEIVQGCVEFQSAELPASDTSPQSVSRRDSFGPRCVTDQVGVMAGGLLEEGAPAGPGPWGLHSHIGQADDGQQLARSHGLAALLEGGIQGSP